jgi:Fe-S cluster biogenesis protein NfuA
MNEKQEFQQRMQRIEELIQRIEITPESELRSSTLELVQSLMELHGAALDRMMEIVVEDDASAPRLMEGFARDELVASVLMVHGLHPVDLETRVLQALDRARPVLQAHGGNVELLGLAEGVVRLRLNGSCNGCASSATTLKHTIEQAIYELAPDVASIEVQDEVKGRSSQTSSTHLVQLERAAARG